MYFMPLFLTRPTNENHEITHGRKFWTHEKKFGTHEIPTRKYFGPTKYAREKILDPRNTHDGRMALDPQDPR